MFLPDQIANETNDYQKWHGLASTWIEFEAFVWYITIRTSASPGTYFMNDQGNPKQTEHRHNLVFLLFKREITAAGNEQNLKAVQFCSMPPPHTPPPPPKKKKKMRQYSWIVHKIRGAHLQCVNNHYAKSEYKWMKTFGVTDYTT